MSDPPEMEPEEIASEGALAVAETFFRALAAGDRGALWALFSETAQAYIINLGLERGMDFDLASRLRSGSASDEEMDGFLGDLISGIQKDLSGVDLARLAFESKAEPEAPLQVRVTYLVQLGPQVADVQPAIPAGAIVLSLQNEEWRIERLVPGPGGRAAAAGNGGLAR
ncbi:MAG: hypothetical protein ABR575_05125 [Actinomycetota bacterium]